MISIGEQFTILESVESTNNYAMAKVRAGLAKQGEAFFALEQIHGKGQRGKAWVTEPGVNIIMTVLLQPQWLQLSQQFRLSAAVALACYDFFAAHAGEDTKIKWPNDIYWRDRKAGGILIENRIWSSEFGVRSRDSRLTIHDSRLTTDTPWQWAIIGMGININQTVFPVNLMNPVSLKQITGKEWNVIDLAKELCGYLQKRCEQLLNNYDLLPEYNRYLYKRNETVRLKKENRVFDAVIKEVNILGQLVVTTGIEEHFNFGEAEWVLR
jgi:BirA family biotin operon repressor/biotin-[acetyl-CoA-carboxylase] ligase